MELRFSMRFKENGPAASHRGEPAEESSG